MAKFKKRIYVEIQKDGDTEYLVAHNDYYDAAKLGERIKVGVYQLVEMREVEALAQLK